MSPRKLVFLLCLAVLGSAAINFYAFRYEAIAAQTRTIQVAAASGPVGE